MFEFYRDPGADGVGVAFTDAVGPDGSVLTLGGAHGAGGLAGAAPKGRGLIEAQLGVRLALVRQVHSDRVLTLADGDVSAVSEQEADGLVTALPGVGLAVRVADCVPVLLADSGAGVVGAAHAGREGLAAGVIQRTIDAMRALGADRIEAWVGPHICGSCYEVPEALAGQIDALVPGTRATTSWGTPSLDLGAGTARILQQAGISAQHRGSCTREDPTLHSYRRDGAASGRQAGVVWIAT